MTWNPFRQEPTIRFKSIRGAPHISPLTTIRRASDMTPDWLAAQRDNGPKDKFMNCPGMVDWMKTGYIIPAWDDIHIKANSAGTVAKFGRSNVWLPPEPMNWKVVNGIAPQTAPVKFAATKLSCPWGVFTKAGYSAHVLPALYHSPFLNDLYVYGGTVDYDSFSTINVMFSAVRECELTIPAGTPLLQVIPFKREPISAEVGRANQDEADFHAFGFPTRVRAAYRKFFHKRKKYTLEESK